MATMTMTNCPLSKGLFWHFYRFFSFEITQSPAQNGSSLFETDRRTKRS
jgi:hypothetical protein